MWKQGSWLLAIAITLALAAGCETHSAGLGENPLPGGASTATIQALARASAGNNPPAAPGPSPTPSRAAAGGENLLAGVTAPAVRQASATASAPSSPPAAAGGSPTLTPVDRGENPPPIAGVEPTDAAATPAPLVYTGDADPCERLRMDVGAGGGENPLAAIRPDQAVRLKLEGHPGPVKVAFYTPGGDRIVTAGGNDVRVWDATSGRPLLTLTDPQGLCQPALSGDGRTLAAVTGAGSVILWDLASGGQKGTLSNTGAGCYGRSVALDPNGRLLATLQGRAVLLWDTASGRQLRRLAGQEDARNPQMVRVSRGHAYAINSVTFSPNGQALLTAADDWTVRLWDVASGQHLRCYQPEKDMGGNPFKFADFSPDGRMVAGVYGAGATYIWDALTGDMATKLPTGFAPSTVAFSPDGDTLLMAGGQDQTARLWNWHTGNLTGLLRHPAWVYWAAFSPDGRRAVTGMGDPYAVTAAGPANAAWVWNLAHPNVAAAARAQDLAAQGVAAARQGDTARAQALFRQAQDVNPDKDYDLAAEGQDYLR